MRPHLLSLLLVVHTVGCFPDLDKRELKPGELRVLVKQQDGSPASTAVARVLGSARLTHADASGAILMLRLAAIQGVLLLSVDDDGDGVMDQAALAPFVTEEQPHRLLLTDGTLTKPQVLVTGVELAPITLQTTRTITGVVREDGAPLAAGRLARVYAVHTITLTDGNTATLPVLAAADVQTDGSYVLPGVFAPSAAETRVLALIRTDADPDRAAVAAVESDSADIDVTRNVDEVVPIDVPITGTDATDVQEVAISRAGRDDFLPADVVGGAGSTAVIDAPVGVFDVQASQGDAFGVAFSLPSFFGATRWLPVEVLLEADVCRAGKDASIDCDQDGAARLPPLDVDAQAHSACLAACPTEGGSALKSQRCETSRGTFDCDDDADGQVDASEPNCMFPFQGTDLDGDDLCEPAADPFLDCATNTAADCL